MKTNFSSHNLIIFCFFIWITSAYSQKTATIVLDKKIYPLSTYNLVVEKMMTDMMDSGKRISYFNTFLAGDYSDSITKFRIAVLPPNGGIKTYMFFIAPYKCDSIYDGPSISSTTVNYSTIIIGVGKRKFKATLLSGNKEIQIIDVSDTYTPPDIKLFENKLPNFNLPLLNGGIQPLTSFEHANKLIYIYIWSPDFKPCLDDFDTLKEVYTTYKNKITMISLLNTTMMSDKIDTIKIKKVVADKHLEWLQGFCNADLSFELFVNGLEYGLLFDENGTVIKMFMLPSELMAYLKKRYGE